MNDVERGRRALERILSNASGKGYPGVPDGAGTYTLYPGYQPGQVYVRLTNGAESSIGLAINQGSNLDPAIQVELERRAGQLIIRQPEAVSAALVYGDGAAAAAGVGTTQPTPGYVTSDGGALTIIGTNNALLGGLIVRITAYHHRGGVWDGTSTITLTPTATANKRAWVLVGINTKTNAITQALTDDQGVAYDPPPRTDINEIVALYPDVDWRGAVNLANGATSITSDLISDLRSGGESLPKSNYSATAAPGVGDDIADGYGVGSLWIDTTNDKVYVCTDGTAGAAVWKQTDLPGTVTSVALSLPAELTVAGSPITSSGTLSATWANQTTNLFFAAPNGSTGTPTFRAIASADLTTALTTPPAIGGTTPNTGAFSTVAVNGATVNSSIIIAGTKNQNAETLFKLTNTTNGTGAGVGFQVAGDTSFSFEAYATGYTVLPEYAGKAALDSNRSILLAAAGSSGVIDFLTGGRATTNKRLTISATGVITHTMTDTATNAVSTAHTLNHNTSGTPAAGYGAAIALGLESSTTENTAVGSIEWLWNTATHASRVPDLVLKLTDSAATREIMRLRANGSAAAIGWFGVTPQARPAAYTQTYSTADRTLGAYTSDAESAAYTGIDNAQAGTVYAQLADLNALRVAYENLRAFVEDAVQMLNAVIDDGQGYGLLQ